LTFSRARGEKAGSGGSDAKLFGKVPSLFVDQTAKAMLTVHAARLFLSSITSVTSPRRRGKKVQGRKKKNF